MHHSKHAFLWTGMVGCGAIVLLACGQIELGGTFDLSDPEASCTGEECSCPPGSHLLSAESAECRHCPLGTVNSEPKATACAHAQVVASYYHTCALSPDGQVRCWGDSLSGELGSGSRESIGDDELPRDWPPVELGARAIQIAAGTSHTCALLEGGDVRCWGSGAGGVLGLGDEENVGDDELPIDRPVIDLGEPALQIAAGNYHSCALLAGGRIRCWGLNALGQLGIGEGEDIGDDEPPRLGGDVDLGGAATAVVLGESNGCALLETGSARCWGAMDLSATFPDPAETTWSPVEAGDLPLPGRVEQISLGTWHACALLAGGTLRCWGKGWGGSLGDGGEGDIPIEKAVEVFAGGRVLRVSAGYQHTCAILAQGNVRCWGTGPYLGYPDLNGETDGMTPEELGDIELGGVATELALGLAFSCALLSSGNVRCWGYGGGAYIRSGGWLGYGNFDPVGDDETPASAGDVPFF